MARTVTVQVRGRGTLTLPASLREKCRLDEGDPLTSVLVTDVAMQEPAEMSLVQDEDMIQALAAD